MDDITVEFAGGDTVRARVIASEPGADLSLLEIAHRTTTRDSLRALPRGTSVPVTILRGGHVQEVTVTLP